MRMNTSKDTKNVKKVKALNWSVKKAYVCDFIKHRNKHRRTAFL